VVFLFSKHKNANGEVRTKTFTIIYLNAKLIINEKEEKESIPLKIPSKENTLNPAEKEEFNKFINEEKEISLLKILVPRDVIKLVISYVKEIRGLQSSNEKFIKMVIKTPFIKKIYGDSTSIPA
jgi:hypothetical protein